MGMGANVRREVLLQFLLTLWIWGTVRVSEGIWLNLPATGTKCVSEELHSNVVVLADYVVVSEENYHLPTISIKVTSPYGNNLHHKENVTHGQFAFTTEEAGNHLVCFWVEGHNEGDADGVELELRKLEGAVDAIHENLLHLKIREAELRNASETTNTRVAWFSIMSLGLCILVSVLQLWHLKSFFQKKKLI
ncbi:transmembrane emp24 domain-containing protein p24delta3 isoform X2 [Manihot esculenta]|uniref:Uncharacterized protein n=1 Tax=Manihot esculenta TaxID=3983 RepID=A0ACB7H1R7_MANES|nr:transmembrane emp24 domain-containing protein p24delta3 isoform X2 [Manihot esculenta]KAG8646161.1 hypothetical protein MANES_10G129300v8 [Manihot esculenta]